MLQMALRNTQSSLDLARCGDGAIKMIFVSIERWKCFPSFQLKLMEMLWNVMGFGKTDPFRVHMGFAQRSYIVYSVNNQMPEWVELIKGLKEGNTLSTPMYDAASFALSVMMNSELGEEIARSGYEPMMVVTTRDENRYRTMIVVVHKYNRELRTIVATTKRFVGDQGFYLPGKMQDAGLQKMEHIIEIAHDTENKKKRAIYNYGEGGESKKNGKGAEVKMVGVCLGLEDDRSRILSKAIRRAAWIPGECRITKGPDLIAHAVESEFRASVFYGCEAAIYGDEMFQILEGVEMQMIINMLGEVYRMNEKKRMSNAWPYARCGMLRPRAYVALKRIKAIPQAIIRDRRRQNMKEVRTQGIEVALGKVVPCRPVGIHATELESDHQIEGARAAEAGRHILTRWKEALCKVGIQNWQVLMMRPMMTDMVARALEYEDLKETGRLASKMRRKMEERYIGRMAEKASKVQIADRVMLEKVRAGAMLGLKLEPVVHCNRCGGKFQCPDVRFGEAQLSEMEKINGLPTVKHWRDSKHLVKEFREHELVCWGCDGERYADELIEAIEYYTGVNKRRNEELGCGEIDVEGQVAKCRRCKKKIGTYAEALKHITACPKLKEKKQWFPVELKEQGYACIACGVDLGTVPATVRTHTCRKSKTIPMARGEATDGRLKVNKELELGGWSIGRKTWEGIKEERRRDIREGKQSLQTFLWHDLMVAILQERRKMGMGGKRAKNKAKSRWGTLQMTSGATTRYRPKSDQFGLVDEMSRMPARKGRVDEVKEKLLDVRTAGWTITMEEVMEMLEVEVEPKARAEKRRANLLKKVARAQHMKGIRPGLIRISPDLKKMRIGPLEVRKVSGFIQGVPGERTNVKRTQQRKKRKPMSKQKKDERMELRRQSMATNARARGEEGKVRLPEDGEMVVLETGREVTYGAYVYPQGARDRVMNMQARHIRGELRQRMSQS